MPRRGTARSPGLIARQGLAAAQCRRLVAHTERHARLFVRMRLEDVALEVSNARDSEPNALRVYEVLVTTGKPSVRLDVRCHDELVVRLPGGGLDRSDSEDDEDDASGERTASFDVRQVRAVVAGLRSSELVHRAIVCITATSD